MGQDTHPVVAETFRWLDSPTEMLKTFVEKHMRPNYSGSQAVSSADDDNGMPVEFQNYVANLYEEKFNYEVKEWRFWIGVTNPGDLNVREPKFAKGFPHSHQWDALTAVHYVQAPAGGGDLVICDDGHKVLHRFAARVGLTAVVDGYSLHGVEAVTGDIPRYTLIATGFISATRNPHMRGRR